MEPFAPPRPDDRSVIDPDILGLSMVAATVGLFLVLLCRLPWVVGG